MTDRPNQFYDPRLTEPALTRRFVFSNGRTSGKSSINGGILEITNADGYYDDIYDWGFSGRTFTLYYGEDGGAFADYQMIQKGTIQQAIFSYSSNQGSKLEFIVRDRQEELDIPVQSTKFAGTNSGSTGLEGLAQDIKGNPKPLCFGQVYNISAVAVNTNNLTYQVHDGPVNTISAVYDNGVALTPGTNHANSAALVAATIAGGVFDTCVAEGYFRLGGNPAGLITADVQGDTTNGYKTTVADIIYQIVIQHSGLVAGDVDTTTFTALNTDCSYVVGLYVKEEQNITVLLDQLCESIGAYWSFSNEGKMIVGQLKAPSGTPDLYLDQYDLIEIDRVPIRDVERGIPVYKVNLSYEKNYTVQSNDAVAGSVTTARMAWLEQDYRVVSVEDTSVLTAHLLAPEMERITLLTSSTDAGNEASRLLTLYKTKRDLFNVVINRTTVDLMDVVSVSLNRFGMTSGKDFRVIGISDNTPSNGLMELQLWG